VAERGNDFLMAIGRKRSICMKNLKIEFTKYDKMEQVLRFVLSARQDKKEIKRFASDAVQVIKTEDGHIRIVCTDGHRLHIAEFQGENIDLETGLYAVVLERKSVLFVPYEAELTFPKWEDCMPKEKTGHFSIKADWIPLPTAITYCLAKVDMVVNYGYLSELARIDEPWTVDYIDHKRSILCKSFYSGANLTALIMPCNPNGMTIEHVIEETVQA
jgi:hypothetical protein